MECGTHLAKGWWHVQGVTKYGTHLAKYSLCLQASLQNFTYTNISNTSSPKRTIFFLPNCVIVEFLDA